MPFRALTGKISSTPFELRRLGEDGGGLRVVEAVDLVDGADDRGVDARLQKRLGDEPVAGADPLLGVDDEEDRVGVRDLPLDPPLHPLGERVARPLHTREVGHDQLPVSRQVGGDAADRPPGGLRALGDDRHVGADDRVDQGGLADVRATRETDEARPAHSEAMTLACSSSISPWSRLVVVPAEVKGAVDRRLGHVGRLLRADEDVAELARSQIV